MPPNGKVQSAPILGPGFTRDLFRQFAWTCWPMLQRLSSITSFIHIVTHPSTRSSSPFMYASILSCMEVMPADGKARPCWDRGVTRDFLGPSGGIRLAMPRKTCWRAGPPGALRRELWRTTSCEMLPGAFMSRELNCCPLRCLDDEKYISLVSVHSISIILAEFYRNFFLRSLRRTTDIQSPSVFAVFVDYTSLEVDLHVYRWWFSFAFPIKDSEYLHTSLYRFSDRPTGVVVGRLERRTFELCLSSVGRR